MIMGPGIAVTPQPAAMPTLRSDASLSGAEHRHLDGSEPRIFPGVVSRHRRSSVQQRPGSSSISEKELDGMAFNLGLKKEDDVVVEEPERIHDGNAKR
jgi:AMP deaminase